MRVLFISFACVLVLLLSLFGVRQWGLMTPYQRFEHAFLDAHPGPHQVVRIRSLDEFNEAVQISKNLIIWLDLRMTADGQFLVFPEDPRPQMTESAFPRELWKGDVLSRYELGELRMLFPQVPMLEDFLDPEPRPRMLLNIVDNATDVHHHLIQRIEPWTANERFLFQSDTDIILRSLKEKKPLWLYGSSVSDLMKILTFESLWLEPASPFLGDVFISGFQLKGRDAFNENVLNEIRRRHKDVFLGPLKTPEEVERARALNPEGFIYDNVELFRKSVGGN